jgi:hypothetical protein
MKRMMIKPRSILSGVNGLWNGIFVFFSLLFSFLAKKSSSKCSESFCGISFLCLML